MSSGRYQDAQPKDGELSVRDLRVTCTDRKLLFENQKQALDLKFVDDYNETAYYNNLKKINVEVIVAFNKVIQELTSKLHNEQKSIPQTDAQALVNDVNELLTKHSLPLIPLEQKLLEEDHKSFFSSDHYIKSHTIPPYTLSMRAKDTLAPVTQFFSRTQRTAVVATTTAPADKAATIPVIKTTQQVTSKATNTQSSGRLEISRRNLIVLCNRRIESITKEIEGNHLITFPGDDYQKLVKQLDELVIFINNPSSTDEMILQELNKYNNPEQHRYPYHKIPLTAKEWEDEEAEAENKRLEDEEWQRRMKEFSEDSDHAPLPEHPIKIIAKRTVIGTALGILGGVALGGLFILANVALFGSPLIAAGIALGGAALLGGVAGLASGVRKRNSMYPDSDWSRESSRSGSFSQRSDGNFNNDLRGPFNQRAILNKVDNGEGPAVILATPPTTDEYISLGNGNPNQPHSQTTEARSSQPNLKDTNTSPRLGQR